MIAAAGLPHSANSHVGTRSGRAAFPNPFTEGTTFQLTMPRPARIKIDVYDIRGKHVRNLFGGEAGEMHDATTEPEGEPIYWDGQDKFGDPVPSGIYIGVLQSDGVTVKSVKVVKIATPAP